MMRECPQRMSEAMMSQGVQPEGIVGSAASSLRDAMVGESPVLEVLAARRPVPCILDTGLQVTLFSQNLFTRCDGDARVKDATEILWLTPKMVNGLSRM